ncbi:hypothetical protein [Azospirillum agricola]|uniref:hypothetical protein n=1 Tax=Azospirillum agricola TaxID=1720247 RepID=UPI001177BEA7|nr:hypothetical protein [Azospirillum agricola]
MNASVDALQWARRRSGKWQFQAVEPSPTAFSRDIEGAGNPAPDLGNANLPTENIILQGITPKYVIDILFSHFIIAFIARAVVAKLGTRGEPGSVSPSFARRGPLHTATHNRHHSTFPKRNTNEFSNLPFHTKYLQSSLTKNCVKSLLFL